MSHTIAVEDLLLLNDEIAALARAGVPLERSLVEFGRDMPGRGGQLAQELGRRMNAGESLLQILEREPERFPPVWRAVIEAGLRSGRLAAALESIATSARRVAELRKIVGAAMVYPLLVLAFAYGLLLFQVTRMATWFTVLREDLVDTPDAMLSGQVWLGDRVWWWAIWLPLIVGGLIGAWWYRAGRLDEAQRSGPMWRWATRWLGFGAIGKSLREGRIATFAEILSLLVRQRVPLQQAVVLAADASGDGVLRDAAREIAERLRRGEISRGRAGLPAEFPPLLGWLLATGMQQPDLGRSLAEAAATYRERAARTATWTATYLPIATTVVIGGSAVLIEALAAFTPIWRLLYDVGQP